MTAAEGVSAGAGGRSTTYPVVVSLVYPSGNGKQRGGVALRNGYKLNFDHFTVRKTGPADEDTGRLLVDAMQTLLRTAPGRPVRFVLKTISAREFRAVKAAIDTELRERGIHDWGYGSSGDTDLLQLGAQHAMMGDWTDLNNDIHSYVSSISNGDTIFTSRLNASPRSLAWQERKTSGSDPVEATFGAIRDSLAGLPDTSRISVWSGSESVNAILRRQTNIQLSKAANEAAKELSNYRKSRALELKANSDPSEVLMRMSTHLCVEGYKKHLLASLRPAVSEDSSQPVSETGL